MKKVMGSLSYLLVSLALFVGIASVNTPSTMFFYQPKVPSTMSKFKR